MRRVHEHRDELIPERVMRVLLDAEHLKIECDNRGVAKVSHVMTLDEWDVIVASVEAARLDGVRNPARR